MMTMTITTRFDDPRRNDDHRGFFFPRTNERRELADLTQAMQLRARR